MKTSNLSTTAVLGWAALDPKPFEVILVALGILVFLIYVGTALPAIWSTKPARRRAAADVLRHILSALYHR